MAVTVQLGTAFLTLESATGALKHLLHRPDFTPMVVSGASFLGQLELVIKRDDICHVNPLILVS
jgi:hypothetical protein